MNVNTLESLISPARLHIYRQTQPNDAIRLYEQNIMLSGSLYPILSILEIALRNAIDRVCCKHFADNNWLSNQKAGFMSDPRLTYTNRQGVVISNDFLRKSVEEAEKKLQKRRGAVSHDGLVAELSFGFWTEMFQPTHYAILHGIPIQAFPNLPATIKRKHLFNILNEIRIQRNRIYHNEPICFDGGACDGGKAWSIRNRAIEVISWISVDLPDWIATYEDSPFEFSLTDRYVGRARRIFTALQRFSLKANQVMRTAAR